MLTGACAPPTICSIDDERWIAVPVHDEPLPLKALVVLDRRPRARRSRSEVSLTRIDSPLVPLLDALLGFPRAPEREGTRFELASVMSCTIGLWRLVASLDTPPHILADTLLSSEL